MSYKMDKLTNSQLQSKIFGFLWWYIVLKYGGIILDVRRQRFSWITYSLNILI